MKNAKNKKAEVLPPNEGQVIPATEQLPSNKQKHVIATAQQFAGPIPPPEIFLQYGQVIPDAPERILKIFELDSQHTREMQMAALKAETDRDKRAQWMAYSIMLASLGLTAFAIKFGNSASGIVAGIATLFVALRVLFIKKDNEQNQQPNNDTNNESKN